MAKEPKKTPEQIKREKERAELEKKEEAELKKRQKEKLKKKKEKEKRIEKQKKREMKRIKSLVNLPFKLLLQVSSLITALSFIVIFFGYETPLMRTIYLCFLIFTMLYLGLGLVMIAIFFLVSQDKIVEMEELKKIEEEQKKLERAAEERELEEMVAMEKSIASKKLAGRQIREDFGSNVKSMPNKDMIDSDENGEDFMLNPASDLDFINGGMNENERMKKANIDFDEIDEIENHQNSEEMDLPDISSFDDIDTIATDDEDFDDNYVPNDLDMKNF